MTFTQKDSGIEVTKEISENAITILQHIIQHPAEADEYFNYEHSPFDEIHIENKFNLNAKKQKRYIQELVDAKLLKEVVHRCYTINYN
jgi:hypothetical protein